MTIKLIGRLLTSATRFECVKCLMRSRIPNNSRQTNEYLWCGDVRPKPVGGGEYNSMRFFGNNFHSIKEINWTYAIFMGIFNSRNGTLVTICAITMIEMSSTEISPCKVVGSLSLCVWVGCLLINVSPFHLFTVFASTFGLCNKSEIYLHSTFNLMHCIAFHFLLCSAFILWLAIGASEPAHFISFCVPSVRLCGYD